MEKTKKTKGLLRLLKYTLIAASAGIIEFGVETLMNNGLKIEWWRAYTVALILSVIWNFTINRKYTFQSAVDIPSAMLKVALYYVVFGPCSVIFGNWLTETCGWNEILVTVINMLINFVTEFLYQRYYVFGKTIDTAKIEKKSA